MADKVTILVVGSDAIRTSVRAVLETDPRLEVIDEADDGDQAVESYRDRPARVVVICQQGREVQTGRGDRADTRLSPTARRIRDESRDARIILVTDHHGDPDGLDVDDAPTRSVRAEAARCLPGVAVELGRR